MRHFVRFAKLSANGSVGRSGWRLRIFLTADEAGAFAEDLAARLWRVEVGEYEDAEPVPAAERARRFRAEVMRAEPARFRSPT